MRLAFLGGGNMGRALIGGLLRRGTRPEQISVGESVESRAFVTWCGIWESLPRRTMSRRLKTPS